VTRHLGFSPHGGEFKVMGLAAFGKPRYKEIILKYNEKSPAFLPQIKGSAAKEIAQVNKDIAASLQAAVEEQVLSIVEYLHKSCASENLCMSGNLALNCLINSMIKNQGIYKNIWIQPAATGAGSAIGGALMAWYRLSGAKRQVVPGKDLMQNCYLGPEYGEDSTRSFLDSQGITYKAIADDDLAKFAAGLIAQGKIVGWFQGRAEFGPRALGGRSILADCRKPQMKERLNRDVKIRELFRPFAPVVLYERAGEYFDWDRESHYMLFAVPTRKGQAEKIPSAVNVDGSSRIQTIKKEDNPLYYDMLNEFYKLTGCPAIINTSLNYLGEPIALTPEDAYCCFKNSDMDCLFLGKFLIEKEVRNG
jgi:carbamoyltransferase